MRTIISFISILFFLNCFSQDEKRLALVIGNSNYDKGELDNPVNDANLISETLDSLGFDILLYKNIETRREFLSAINEFSSKIKEYDATFIYYAGHGVQINNENYLLPTKEIYESETDVEDYGLSMQRILKLIEIKDKNKVNILVIDACRDNPFEQSWNKTRSLKGSGLAKTNPPTGSLLAFSTESGSTAPDGKGGNSIYTLSLSKNLLKPAISIEQVFKNVRSDVLNETDGVQKPIENNTLIGDEYIFNKSELKKIESDLLLFIDEWVEDYMIENIPVDIINSYVDKISVYDKNNPLAVLGDLIMNVALRSPDTFDSEYDQIDFKLLDNKVKNTFLYLKAYNNQAWLNYFNCYNNNDDKECDKLVKETLNIASQLIDVTSDKMLFWENKSIVNKVADIEDLWETVFLPSYYKKGLENINLSIYYDFLEKYVDFIEEQESSTKDYPSFNYDFLVTPKTIMTGILGSLNEISNKELALKWDRLYQEFPKDLNLMVFQVRNSFLKNDFKLAQKLINEYRASFTNDPEINFIQYSIYLDSGDYLKSLYFLDRAIKIVSNDDGFYISEKIVKSIGPSNNNLLLMENQASVYDLIILKIKLLITINDLDLACIEYRNTLDNLYANYNDDIIDELEYKKRIDELNTNFNLICNKQIIK